MILYGGTDPGVTGSQIEGHLDVEWANAIAPKATINYIYGANAFTAFIAAVNTNLSPDHYASATAGARWITALPFYRAIGAAGQRAGDHRSRRRRGTAGSACDRQGSIDRDARTRSGISDGAAGDHFRRRHAVRRRERHVLGRPRIRRISGSALSYIPEAAWNETSGINGLLAGGGGVSAIHPQPAWQQGPGVPGGRHAALSRRLSDGGLA